MEANSCICTSVLFYVGEYTYRNIGARHDVLVYTEVPPVSISVGTGVELGTCALPPPKKKKKIS